LFQWQLNQYGDSLEAGTYLVFFFNGSKIFKFHSENQTIPVAHLPSYSVNVVVPSPLLKQLMHKGDHSPLFSAEVADECSCYFAPRVCLRGVHRTSLPFTITFEE
jgi:hypothetical protein